jgi:O-antigen/teichoic acid export membrane protein
METVDPARAGVAAPPPPAAPEIRPSLVRNSFARLVADGAALVAGGIATIITARVLGPAGQGVFATLAFVSGLFVLISGLGLGDAVIVRVGQGRADYRRAAGTALVVGLMASAVGAGVTVLVGALQIRPDDRETWLAVGAAAAQVPLGVATALAGAFLNVRERVREASLVFALTAVLTTVGVAVFVLALDMAVFGALLAGVVASSVALVVAAGLLRTHGLMGGPRFDLGFLRGALPFALRVQAGGIVLTASNRLDLVVVFSLAGRADAGFYSIALTVGTLASLVPWALSYAAFPRLARLPADEATDLIARSFRVAVAAALFTGALLALAVPVAIPLLLGSEYDASVVPALILLIGGVLVSGQWTLARAFAARGDSRLLVRSFSASLATMLALDFLLIPPLDIAGAALAAVAGTALGLAVCLLRYRRDKGGLASLVPRPADFSEVLRTPGRLLRRRGDPDSRVAGG